jgi:hypothetical protein
MVFGDGFDEVVRIHRSYIKINELDRLGAHKPALRQHRQ